MSSDTTLLDWAKIIIPSMIGLISTLVILQIKGVFSRIKREGAKEMRTIKTEAAFEKTDAVTDVLITNTIKQLESIREKHEQLTENVAKINTEVAVIKTEINHLIDGTKDLITQMKELNTYVKMRNGNGNGNGKNGNGNGNGALK